MCNIEINHRVVSTESRYFLDPHPCVELRPRYLGFIHLLSVEAVLHIISSSTYFVVDKIS